MSKEVAKDSGLGRESLYKALAQEQSFGMAPFETHGFARHAIDARNGCLARDQVLFGAVVRAPQWLCDRRRLVGCLNGVFQDDICNEVVDKVDDLASLDFDSGRMSKIQHMTMVARLAPASKQSIVSLRKSFVEPVGSWLSSLRSSALV